MARDERECGRDVVRAGGVHEVLVLDGDLLALREVRRGVEQREETATGRPRELVAERVVGALGGGEATAEGVELLDL